MQVDRFESSLAISHGPDGAVEMRPVTEMPIGYRSGFSGRHRLEDTLSRIDQATGNQDPAAVTKDVAAARTAVDAAFQSPEEQS